MRFWRTVRTITVISTLLALAVSTPGYAKKKKQQSGNYLTAEEIYQRGSIIDGKPHDCRGGCISHAVGSGCVAERGNKRLRQPYRNRLEVP